MAEIIIAPSGADRCTAGEMARLGRRATFRAGVAIGGVIAAALGLAATAVGAPKGTPPNDECAGALNLPMGSTFFSTVGATTTPLPLPVECEKGFGLSFVNDIWYTHTAAFTGTLEVTTCNMANFDTRLAAYLYAETCDTLTLVACNDDGAGCGLFTSIMQMPVTEGTTYFIRLGAFFGSGSGLITLTDELSPICVPSNHDCFSVGFPGCNDIDCCTTVCEIDPFCCVGAWDMGCIDQATQLCTDCEPGDCVGDLNGDGVVDGVDLGLLLLQWDRNGSGDLDCNGKVDGADLGLFLLNWGQCP